MYFKIKGTYFKIYGLYFLLSQGFDKQQLTQTRRNAVISLFFSMLRQKSLNCAFWQPFLRKMNTHCRLCAYFPKIFLSASRTPETPAAAADTGIPQGDMPFFCSNLPKIPRQNALGASHFAYYMVRKHRQLSEKQLTDPRRPTHWQPNPLPTLPPAFSQKKEVVIFQIHSTVFP